MNQTTVDVAQDLIDALQPDSFTTEQPEQWQPNTIDEVDWCAQKAAQADQEFREAAAAAQRQIDKINAWLAEQKTRRDDRVAFFEGHAVQFLLRKRAEEAQAGVKPERLTKSIKLIGSGARIQSRQQPDKITFEDEEALITWAETNGAPHLVRVKKSIAKAELNKHVKETGELPEGVAVEPGEIVFTLKLPEPNE